MVPLIVFAAWNHSSYYRYTASVLEYRAVEQRTFVYEIVFESTPCMYFNGQNTAYDDHIASSVSWAPILGIKNPHERIDLMKIKG